MDRDFKIDDAWCETIFEDGKEKSIITIRNLVRVDSDNWNSIKKEGRQMALSMLKDWIIQQENELCQNKK